MRVEQLGEGTPEVAVIGAIHGDEPSGVHAIERLLADAPTVERPVKLIVANEEALDRGVRYVDADLNRAFGPDDRDSHEGRLARRLADELAGTTALALHATRSHPEPFGVIADVEGVPATVVARLPVVAVVLVEDTVEGRLFEAGVDLVEVEAGRQGSDAAAENAYRIARAFLAATGALAEPTERRDPPVYRLGERIDKPAAERYEVFAENFERVDAGQPFAAADGESVVAPEAFYPILLSARGYADQFGYTGEFLGRLSEVAGSEPPP